MKDKKKKGKVESFIVEFRKFIMRGNVLDMSVGVIIGGAFTAIVDGLSENILKPIINKLLSVVLKKEGLEGVITMLSPSYTNGELDLANSIYINWGAFLSAIINFLLVAFVLFIVVKTINHIADVNEELRNNPEWTERKAIARIRYEERMTKKEAREEWLRRVEAEKLRVAEEKRLAEEQALKEKMLAEEKATANLRLLEEIRDLLTNK